MRSPILCLGLLALTTAWPVETTSITQRDGGDTPPRNGIYIQTFRTASDGELSLLPLIKQKTQLTHIYLSALHVNSEPGDITLNDKSPNDTLYDTIWKESTQLQQSGIKVMMMLGGAAPGSYPRLCSGKGATVLNEDYYVPLYHTLKFHKVDGLDLDIEETVAYTCPLAILRRLHQDFGPSFVLTMAPVASELQPEGYGLGGFNYKTLDSEATAADKPNGKLVNWYNAQFYNGWGDASTPIGYNAIVANGYPADRVVMGVLDSKGDGGSGWYPVGTYQNTISTLKATYSKFGCVVGWEYWDAGINDTFADPWQWVEAIGKSVFASNGLGRVNNVSEPIPLGPSPFSSIVDTLVEMGVAPLAANRALNISHGEMSQALQILGLESLDLPE